MAEAAVLEQNQWLLVETAFPELDRRAEQRAARYLGGLIAASEVMIEPVETNESTLMAAAQMAALGDQASRRVVETNVSTDLVERLFKIGQTRVRLQVGPDGLRQEGRRMTDIHRNTLVHTVLNNEMYSRTTGQLKNAFVFEELLQAGILATHDALVCEPCPFDEETRRDYNFFTATDSLSMQLLSVEGSAATLETAFVAGKKTPVSPRHDLATIHAMAAQKGVELVPTDANGITQYIMLIPKTDQPTRVEDIVAEYDQIAGTFYGQAKPRQDYHQFAEECYARNQSFDDLVQTITEQLISEAPAFTTPLEAIKRLDYLSERYSVKQAQTDSRIDATVFGPQAAFHIEQARLFLEQGDESSASESMMMAQKTANSSSCPIFKGSTKSPDGNDNNDGKPEKSEHKWMKCPHCEAKVFADPCASVLKCWDCKAKVISGITFKGNGGSKKRREDKIKAQAELTTV